MPSDVGRAGEFCLKSEAVCFPGLHPRIFPTSSDTMGFFNEKKGMDMENGADLKADDSTNIQGQTDAVFGEVVEGGPNYRNVGAPVPQVF
jgi:hypothetical protein